MKRAGTKTPEPMWMVGTTPTPLRAPCMCGATLASHMHRAPHAYPRGRCGSFRLSAAGMIVLGLGGRA